MQDVNQGQGSYGSMGSMPGSFWEENRSLATGVVLASAVAAGVIAYMLRRAREEETPIETATDLPGRAWERARGVAGDERVDAARDFVMERVLPELKPALLAILHDLEGQVDDYFRRAEKSIKRL